MHKYILIKYGQVGIAQLYKVCVGHCNRSLKFEFKYIKSLYLYEKWICTIEQTLYILWYYND